MRTQSIVALGVALLTSSAPAAGCDPSVGSTSGDRNTYTITEPVTSLTIDNPIGNTEIEGTDTDAVSVTERLRYTGNPPKTSHSITGGRLTLSYTCPSRNVDVDVNINVDVCSVSYVVKVPRRIAVQIDGKVGAVTLAGLAGPLTLSSSAGNIDATRLTSDEVTARASAGAITLRFTAPPNSVDARAQVGSVTVRLPANADYAVDAGSQVGQVEVTVREDSGSAHRIEAHSQVGSVTVNNG